MKAGQWDHTTNKVVVNEVPIPEPGPGQVLIKVSSASLCHSDLMHHMRRDRRPITIGHEGVGIITKVHSTAEGHGFQVGDHVGCGYVIGCCFECEGCLTHNLLCSSGKQKLQGFTADGFFAEYAVEDWQNLAKLPESMDLTRAAAFHAIDSCELKPGQWLAVVGCGGLGQLATHYAKKMGLNVIGIDINDAKLDVVKKQGADAVFNSRSNTGYVEELKRLTNGGTHAVAVFSDADAAYAAAPDVLRVNGVLMVIGIPKSNLSVNPMDLVSGKYRIKAECTSIPQRMMKAVDFICKHNILPGIEFHKLEELPEMLDALQAGTATKRMAVIF
ncbi:alcohol dehydrogenase [Venturia nashicola]|uniref:Alcohol dehydrogenase n=1 Tax=Venturia nashicola TaxID=86259 RepID=A0A4Z1PAR3_9PEZI|nr:alcohol dehydrogenase [Venturia nashicola]